MTWTKRLFDLALVLILAGPAFIILVVLAVTLVLSEGRPLFYISERMKTPTRAFALVKLRTMQSASTNGGVTGGDKTGRISPFYRFLRKSRLDELPQLWNIFIGDMSFVGPRPPLRVYVADYPDLYRQVLRNRPGVTGLATLRFHNYEERLLAICTTSHETDHVYRTRCIPRKAAFDLIYHSKQSLCFDLVLIGQTAGRLFGMKK